MFNIMHLNIFEVSWPLLIVYLLCSYFLFSYVTQLNTEPTFTQPLVTSTASSRICLSNCAVSAAMESQPGMMH